MGVNLADFLTTNLMKLAVIGKSVKSAGFFGPDISSKITLTKEKGRRKRKSEEKKRRRREKSNSCTLSFYNLYGYFGDSFWPEKNCWTQLERSIWR